jgi:hypothetical protein
VPATPPAMRAVWNGGFAEDMAEIFERVEELW